MNLDTRDRYETTHCAVAPVVASVVLTFTHPILFLPKARGMLPCPMETRATVTRSAPQAAYIQIYIQIQRISGRRMASLRALYEARLAKEGGGSATTLPSGRCMGGSATTSGIVTWGECSDAPFRDARRARAQWPRRARRTRRPALRGACIQLASSSRPSPTWASHTGN